MNNLNSVSFYTPITKVEERIFLNSINNITLKNQHIQFDKKIRINVASSRKAFSNEIRSMGTAVIKGNYQSDDDLFTFLEAVGIPSEVINSERTSYRLNDFHIEGLSDFIGVSILPESKRITIYINSNLPADYSFKKGTAMSYGTTEAELKTNTTAVGYFLTSERIYAKKQLRIDMFIKLAILILTIAANFIYIKRLEKVNQQP